MSDSPTPAPENKRGRRRGLTMTLWETEPGEPAVDRRTPLQRDYPEAPRRARVDPHKFYTGATDSKGHSATMYVRVPTYLAARASAVVARLADKYHSVHSLLRDALTQRIGWLEEHVDELQREESWLEAAILEEAKTRAVLLEASSEVPNAIEEFCRKLFAAGRYDQLVAYVVDQRSIVRELVSHPAQAAMLERLDDYEARAREQGGGRKTGPRARAGENGRSNKPV